MTQTFDRVKSSLIALLRDQDNKVIALTGKWGTGKTHLWKNVVAVEMFGASSSTEQPIYVSLFGVRAINELKLRILQNTYIKDASSVKKAINTGGSWLAGALNKFLGLSVESTALIRLPQIINGRLIVIDDVERKHKSLHIDELLGMLDEYSGEYKTRFLILLNSNKLLENTEMWAVLHEKVIDAEVVLDPTIAESLDIAAKGDTSAYMPSVRAAIMAININNIRVIERIIKNVKKIDEATKGIGEIPAERWVQSTVLLSACHYRAIENPPPFEYLESLNQYSHFFKDKKDAERDPKEVDWDLLLDKLNIKGIDAYEEIFHRFLQSGLLDKEGLLKQFERYKIEGAQAEVFTKQQEFFKAALWGAQHSEENILAIAKEFLQFANILGPDSISDIASTVEELGDAVLARQLLDAWMKSIETRSEYQQMNDVPFDTSHRKYHPDVICKMNEMRNKQHPPLTILQTVERIIDNGGWGNREESSLHNSTVTQYENELRNITGDQLRRFLNKNIEWSRGGYSENFKIAAGNFVEACRNIYLENPNSRLSKIIHRTFGAYQLAKMLEQPAASVEGDV